MALSDQQLALSDQQSALSGQQSALSGQQSALSGQQFTITAGEHEATVVEVGGGLRRYVHRGVDVTCGYATDVLAPKCCGGVLVPWPNRLRGGRYRFEGADYQLALTEPAAGNAIHGLGRWERWRALRQDTASVTLTLDVVPQS